MSEKNDGACYKDYTGLINMFNNFFENGKMASTYKPMFLRALADIGKYDDPKLVGRNWIHCNGPETRLDLDFIAIRFAKYYWDMEFAFGFRHTPKCMANKNNPNQDTNIVSLIKEKMPELKNECNPPTLTKLASDSMGEFRKNVISGSIKPEVLGHLLKDMPDLYRICKNKNYIILKSHTLRFMKKFLPIINRALNYTLALKLEQLNQSSRYIATKINDEKELSDILTQIRDWEPE